MAETILQNEKPPKVIVFGIDPKSLNFNRHSKWLRHKQNFFNIKSKLEGEYPDDNSSSTLALVRNLINLEYFLRSLQLILSEKTQLIKKVQEFDHQLGIGSPVLLPDGSLIHSAESILSDEVYNKLQFSTGETFGIRGSQWVNEKAVELFIRLVNHLQQQKFKIILILTPFHPVAWNSAEQSGITEITVVESKVHEIARLTGVQVIGSYNPIQIGCTADDFFNGAHPKAKCVTKIERTSVSYRTSKE
jgi:hypothetical protein